MSSSYSVDLRDLLEAGCHFGHQARRWNPKMGPYIFTNRDGVHIFDLEKTAAKLITAMEWVRDWVASGKDIVFVGTKRQAADIVKEEVVKAGAPYVNVRWLGGTLTNWEEMAKRIKKMITMKEGLEKGEYKDFTKKEQGMMAKEIAKLERFFGGLAKLSGRPEALFVVDTQREATAVKEAGMIGIPVVGMVDTNADPDLVAQVIPVNDDAVRSIKLVVAAIAQAYAEGKMLRQKAPVANQVTRKEDGGAKQGVRVQRQDVRGKIIMEEGTKGIADTQIKNPKQPVKQGVVEGKQKKVIRKATAKPEKKAKTVKKVADKPVKAKSVKKTVKK